MRSSIFPAGLMLFLLLCLTGCGGGDSTGVASSEGGGESVESESGEGEMESYGGEGEGGEGMYGEESREEGGEGTYGEEGMEGEMYGEEDREEGMMGEEGMEEGMYGEEDREEGMYAEGGAEDEMYGEESREEGMMGEEGTEGEMYGEEDREEGMYAEGGAEDEMYGEESREEGMMGEEGMEGEMYGEEDREEGMMGEEGREGEMYGEEGRGGGPEGMYGRGPGARQTTKPKTFAGMATQAFGQGRDAEAFQFLYAQAVTADDTAARELLGKMGWIAPLKRPGLAVRWGIGIEFNSKGYNGQNLYPIGTTQQVQQRGNRGGYGQGRGGGEMRGPQGLGEQGMGNDGFGGEGRGPGMQGGGSGGANAQLERFTGELGQKFVAGLQDRVQRGDFGQVLKNAGSAGTTRPGGSGQYGEFGGGEEQYGEEGGGMYGAGPSGGRRGAGGAGRPEQLVPGVTFLDVAPAKDLLRTAEQAGIDVLCVFNISVTQIRRTGQVSNSARIHLYNVSEGKKAFESDMLNNLAVQAARAKESSRGGDPVDKELQKVFQEIDTNWRLGPLPTLQPEHVLSRIGDVLKETHPNPLPVLAEIRMYKTRGLLQDNHLQLAYQRMTNDQSGTILATGTEEERKQVIQPWLPVGGN